MINAEVDVLTADSVLRMESGIQLANELLDSGRALEKLREFQRFFAR